MNFYGVLTGCQLVLPEMVKRRRGHIVNIASMAGMVAPLRFVGAVTSMLGPRGRRWLPKQMGNDRVFLDFDARARQTYEDRARSATGVVDKQG